MEEKLLEEFKEELTKKGIDNANDEEFEAEFEAFMKKKTEELKKSHELDEEMLELVTGGGLWSKIKKLRGKWLQV